MTDFPCFNSDMGRVNVSAAKVIEVTTSYESNAHVIQSWKQEIHVMTKTHKKKTCGLLCPHLLCPHPWSAGFRGGVPLGFTSPTLGNAAGSQK